MNNKERERVFELFAIYEPVLTKAQAKAIEDHFAYDLSFGEISKENDISRAAVNENVKSALAKMEELENKLHLVERKKELISIAGNNAEDCKKLLEEFLKK